MNNKTIELRDQNIRIAEERGRPELVYQHDKPTKKIILADSDKERLRITRGRFAKKSVKKGGDEKRSFFNNRVKGPQVGGPE